MCRIWESLIVRGIQKKLYKFVNTAILSDDTAFDIAFKTVSLHNFLSLNLRRISNGKYNKYWSNGGRISELLCQQKKS